MHSVSAYSTGVTVQYMGFCTEASAKLSETIYPICICAMSQDMRDLVKTRSLRSVWKSARAVRLNLSRVRRVLEGLVIRA
jgi:hypothetical protein